MLLLDEALRLMDETISNLFTKLKPDPWRLESGFAPEVYAANEALWGQNISGAETEIVLNEWIKKYQPCLFGRIAAKLGLITYCVLSESDIAESDKSIKAKIQRARLNWARDAFEGKKSGFVIAVVSQVISEAIPDETVKELARRLSSLYLLTDISLNEIYLDEIFLEKPGQSRTTWKWDVGVNYFSAQADKRWWQDHRIPGGMAFSMNSVGHMVKSSVLASAMNQFNEALGDVDSEAWIPSKVDSLESALEFAMRTIHGASDSVSGKATRLLPLPSDKRALPVKTCPVELPDFLKDKNFCNYEGYYHTDYTLPSEYFLADVERPPDIKAHTLDFTYLFDKRLDNPDFERLGLGRRVRGKQRAGKAVGRVTRARSRVRGRSVRVLRYERLIKNLKNELEMLGYGRAAIERLTEATQRGKVSSTTNGSFPTCVRSDKTVLGNSNAHEISRITPWADISHKTIMVEATGLGDVEHERVLRNLEQFGICLLRIAGLAADSFVIEEVGRFIGPACEKQNQFVGRIKELRPEQEGLVNSGDSAKVLGFHVDGTQHENQPDILVFQYVTEPQIGAHSVFIDAAKVLLDIEEEARHQLLVRLARPDAAEFVKRDMVYKGPLFSISDTGSSVKCRLRFDNVINVNPAYRDSFELIKDAFSQEQYPTSFRPRDGDVIVFDNGRVLHARDQVFGPRVRIHRRMWISGLKPRLRPDYLLGVRPLPVETLSAIKRANRG